MSDCHPPYAPMEFAGWFEAFLGNQWYVFDPRNNAPRMGRVLIARGRDAVDVAISTAFGPNTLTSFKVICDETKPGGPQPVGTISPTPNGSMRPASLLSIR